MTRTTYSPLLTLLSCAFVLIGFSSATRATPQVASNTEPEKFTAFAVNMSNVGTGATATVDITINRWSTDAERDRLMGIFKEKGPDALLESLREVPPVGTIRTPDSLAYDLRFARELPGEDGGRQIILATDRPIGFWEAANRPRTIDYPFTVIELRLDKDNRGSGKLSIATKLTLRNNVLVLENYASQPVMLNNVRKLG
jgi:hypothetical protein